MGSNLILSKILDENGLEPCQDQFLHPIQVHSWKNKKNIGSQRGQTHKKTLKKGCQSWNFHYFDNHWSFYWCWQDCQFKLCSVNSTRWTRLSRVTRLDLNESSYWLYNLRVVSKGLTGMYDEWKKMQYRFPSLFAIAMVRHFGPRILNSKTTSPFLTRTLSFWSSLPMWKSNSQIKSPRITRAEMKINSTTWLEYTLLHVLPRGTITLIKAENLKRINET